MAAPRIKDRKELTEDWIRRVITHTDRVTWFGGNSIARAWATATGALVENSYQLYVAILRRFTLFASSDEDLAVVAAERGAQRLGPTRARLMVVFQPFVANVTAITIGATDLIEVDDSSGFTAGDSLRIRNGDGTVTDVRTIIAITIGTGPNLGDELEVATLTGAYTPLTDDVDVLLRATIPEGSIVTTTQGVLFQTLETVVTGDANAVLDGEGTFLGLADKVWCEATERGVSGNIEPRTVTGLQTPITGIVDVFNPERAVGGADSETDFELKRRAIEGPAIASAETEAWFEALAKAGNSDVLRVVRPTDIVLATLVMRIINRNGGGFSTTELSDLETYIEQHVRSFMSIDLENIVLTSVEIDAEITIEATADLEEVWREYSNRVAAYLDYRKWSFGLTVEAAQLRRILEDVPGVASVDAGTFLPAADVTVSSLSLPTLTRISLLDLDSTDTINADLSVSF